MYYERLSIEATDDGWVRFSCPDRLWAGESAHSLLQLTRGFDLDSILAAAAATGWTEQRDGEWRILSSQSCRELVCLLDAMLEYFDGPDEPHPQVLQIKAQVDALLADDPDTGAVLNLTLWHYARLDLLLRENLADAARSLDGIWVQDDQLLDVRGVRTSTIRRFCQDARLADVSARRMAPSARTQSIVQERGKTAG